MHAHEITNDEKKQEIWRIFFYVAFDLIGVSRNSTLHIKIIGSTYVVFFINEEECEVPLKFWYISYGLQSLISGIFYLCLIKEVSKNYITKSSEAFSFLIDL